MARDKGARAATREGGRGRGGLDGKLVVLVGGSGFFGQHTAQALLKRGARLRIASRHPERAHRLKPLGNLGQIQFARFDASRSGSAAQVLAGCDAVVNLAGSFTGNVGRLMGEAPGWLAEAAAAEGASAFVHVSALLPSDHAADGPYAAAKRRGEAAVQAAFPQATIVRPAILFGANDAFVSRFAGLVRAFRVLPVFGADAPLQPAYVEDVAEAIAAALADPATHGGKTYELAGPEVLTMGELNARIAAAQNRRRLFAPVPDPLAALFAALPGTPMSGEQWRLLRAGNRPGGGQPGFRELGIVPRPLGLFLDRWMVRYRKHGRFAERLSA